MTKKVRTFPTPGCIAYSGDRRAASTNRPMCSAVVRNAVAARPSPNSIRLPVAAPGRPPFTTSHLVQGEQTIPIGTGIPVDVHPTRDLFRLAAG
ncbi:MAG: hypothetical protein HOV94_11190 [Saccharothrix sp.]|nr:hypothetical protein [Saccharothrix sp.]